MKSPKSSLSHADHLSPIDQFRNSQEYLEREAKRALEDRRAAGLEGLVGELACVIINVEPDCQRAAVEELQHYTGLSLLGAHRGPMYITAVLSQPEGPGGVTTEETTRGQDARVTGGQDARDRHGQDAHARGGARPPAADVLVRSRRLAGNPFASLNDRPKSRRLPNTRLETFVFECPDLDRYVAIQKSRGVRFVTDDIIRMDTYSFIQTMPSPLIGASYGFIQWSGRRTYHFGGAEDLDWSIPAPRQEYRPNIGRLDHVATRLNAMDRDSAILEFVRLTNHRFEFAIYVESLNSITNVTRRSRDGVGLVFTSGIAPYQNEATAGPTEKFVYNYGPRTHHLAFETENIEPTYEALRRDGVTFMVGLVGGPKEGLHQTFTDPSERTMIVTEYIHRYNGFEGYFTLSNVTALTAASEKQ
jgi:hypothetical protein